MTTRRKITNIQKRGGKVIYTLSDCLDVGVDDPYRAARNRLIIKDHLYTEGYRAIEQAVSHTPTSRPLASWIPKGNLPEVGENDFNQGGDKVGLHLIDEPSLVVDDPSLDLTEPPPA